MQKLKKFILREIAGQGCDVEITIRDNGSVKVTFQSMPGYGYPSLEKEDLIVLLKYISKLEAIDENINGNASIQ